MRSILQLDTLFTVGALLDDRDGDGLPDALRTRIVLGPRAQRPEHLATVDLAARLGFASLALELPLACADLDPLPAGIGDGAGPLHGALRPRAPGGRSRPARLPL
jgi:hypothetical protein